MGNGGFAILFLFLHILLLTYLCSSHPLCTDSRAPSIPKTPLTFCHYNGSTCCDSTMDSRLRKQFQGMNVSDSACSSLLKSVLCAQCDQFSADLFNIKSGHRTAPVLCNSTISVNLSQSKSASTDFCGKVWDTCQHVSIANSPFAPSLQGSAAAPANMKLSKLTDLWQSKTAFCEAFGGSSGEGSVCFDGEPVSLNKTEMPSPPNGMCLEKIGNGSYLNMVAHPDGSDRVFLSNQKGQIWLATVPIEGSGGTLDLDESTPFLDLTDEVHFDTEFGLMGMAFHPNFASNGRLFVSFNCDKVTSPRCSGKCSCNSDAMCDPSKLGADNGAQPCRYHSVVAEYSTNSSASRPSLATTADPSEVRRIFTMGLPFTGHHGGQILIGPEDGYLYFMMGDGGKTGDPFNFSQNKKTLLGKIMRLDIDNIPSATEITDLGLWGNYSIPKDNPSSTDKDLLPEIWTLGMRNPWRCSFDSERPSYFLCADVGQDSYEEVDIITKGGNYGWRIYEGNNQYHTSQSLGGTTSSNTIDPIFPVMGYKHNDVNKKEGSASIIGGYFYRSMTDPCMYGSYLFTDLYAGAMWAGTESPKDSGKFTTTQIPFSCAHNSPLPCSSVEGSPLPALGYIFSYGEDNHKDIFLLASSGVYRVVRPSRCNYTCSKDTGLNSTNPRPTSPSSSSSMASPFELLLLLSSCLFVLLATY